MGAWGMDIFEDDTAADIQADFNDALEEGASVDDATDAIMEQYADSLDDTDERFVVWLALAALQLEQGAVRDDVRRQVVAIIESGEDLERLAALDANEESIEERRGVLAALQARLVA